MQLWQDMTDIVTAPFVGSIDISHLFLLVGLVLFFLVVWVLILEHLKSAAMDIVE